MRRPTMLPGWEIVAMLDVEYKQQPPQQQPRSLTRGSVCLIFCETTKRDFAQGVFYRYQGLEQNNVVNRESKIKCTQLLLHIPIVSY